MSPDRRGEAVGAHTAGGTAVATLMTDAGQSPLVIANPAARRGRTGGEIEAIVRDLRARIGNVDVVQTERAGHATALAAAAVAGGRTLLVVVGGDGVLNEVVNGLLGQEDGGGRGSGARADVAPDALPALGILTAGTGGDFIRSLGMAAGRDAQLAAIAAGRKRAVDVAHARFRSRHGDQTQRWFVNVLSAGIGGLVDRYAAAMPAVVPGRVAYGAAALAGVVLCRRRRIACRATLADGSRFERLLDTHAVAVANGHTFGGGMRIAPAARVDDGLLDVVLFETPTKLTLLRHFASVYRGEHLTKPGVSTFTCTRVELEPAGLKDADPRGTAHLFPLDVDGDPLGDIPLAIAVHAGRLRVLA